MRNNSNTYKDSMEMDANAIWLSLLDHGTLSIEEVGKVTNLEESSIYLALGWLTRENEIQIFEEHDILYVELHHSISEMFYGK
ncbi:MAG: winged helix-turn-helix domain-containing protein [Bacteroidales bacterium]|jgi:hypothetical protein|nr:winged helix-turn-helix domain-containing protein [Bacteroidales bacterium]